MRSLSVKLIEQIFHGIGVVHAHQQQIVLPAVSDATVHQYRGKLHAIGGGPLIQFELFEFARQCRRGVVGRRRSSGCGSST